MPDKKVKYPTQPNSDGFYFATEEEASMDIKTKDYKNGQTIKEVVLKNSRVAVIRKLKGRDFVETKKQIQNDKNLDFETVNMAQAVTFEGKQEPPEYYLDDLFQSDFATLMVAFGGLNF